ncbi:MAG: beta-lactamase family protein [Oscillospiraceae bacterium]|nr:beta-lactamase family protein [Oscillospiraceae bacterium]
MKDKIINIIDNWVEEDTENYAGVLSATSDDGVIFQKAIGLRNRGENLPCETDTAFGIASGTKLFTGLAACKLIDSGKLKLDDKLCDLLSFDLGKIDKRVTVHQLLTHTSGVGDYIDEEAEDFDEQYTALMKNYPAHLWINLEYYLQMITPLEPKFEPGERCCYSNSGYVLLGLVIEAVSGTSYQKFVKDEIIDPCDLTHTGFYRSDSLPDNTAIGYMQDEDTEAWSTNREGLPIIGGSDGGIYSCAADMDRLWRAIFDNKVLSADMTNAFLKSYVVSDEDGEDDIVESFGLGVYHYSVGGKIFYSTVGADNGVGFFSAYYPATKTVISSFCNTGYNGCSLLFGELVELL